MGKDILVIGELNVDIIVGGLHLMPKLGQEVLVDNVGLVLGSSSATCAAGLTRLGAQVDFLGKVGQDYYGDFVVAQLSQLGMGTEYVARDQALHTGATVSLAFSFDRALMTYLGSIQALRLEDIPLAILPNYHHLHVGSYFLQRGLRPGVLELFREAHQAGLTVSLDTGHDPEGKWIRDGLLTVLTEVDIFLPNEAEACAIAGVKKSEAALRDLARRARLVVVKRGPRGAMSLRGGRVLYSPGFSVRAVDTTGAGDSFDAGFIHAHVLQGLPLDEALAYANACGALCTTGYGGTGTQPSRAQVEAFLKEQA
jgi:sugar/nucleoside kinase (ribokinase family)